MQKMVVRTFILFLTVTFVGYFCWLMRPLIEQRKARSEGWDITTEAGFTPHQGITQVQSTYRGDNHRTGYFQAENFNPKLELKWALGGLFADIHPASKSTPAADESGIYFGSDLGIFYKVSHKGEILWSFSSESGNQGIHGSALLDQKYVYFGNYAGKFYCLDKQTGGFVWSTRVAHAVGSSPLLAQGNLIFSAEFNGPREGYMVSLDASTGVKQWASNYFGEQVHSSPTLSEQDDILGVGTNAGEFLGIDRKSGQISWHFKAGGPIKGTAVYVQGQFCFGSWDKYFHCVNSFDGKKTFSVELNGASQSSAAFDPKTNQFYISSSSGDLFKVSLKDRRIIQQVSLKMQGKTNRYSMPSPIVVSSKEGTFVISACEDSKICIWNASNLRLIQKVEVGGLVTGSFLLFNSSIYANVNNHGLVRLN